MILWFPVTESLRRYVQEGGAAQGSCRVIELFSSPRWGEGMSGFAMALAETRGVRHRRSDKAGSVRRTGERRRQGRTVMTQWIRFERNGRVGFGTLQDGTIAVHAGDMLAG